MNAYVFDVFITHSIVMEDFEEDGIYTTTCDLVEVGPLNIPDFNKFRRIKKIVRDISSTEIASNWWTDFSTWEDFSGILRTGTKLSMHSVVQEINSKLELLENNTSYVDLIEENGNILIQHDETFPNLSQGFLLTAKRRRLRTLKDIAAYNVAKYTESTSDVKVLTIPPCLHDLVSTFLDTYSGDYLSV
jgi:hypothetical protein